MKKVFFVQFRVNSKNTWVLIKYTCLAFACVQCFNLIPLHLCIFFNISRNYKPLNCTSQSNYSNPIYSERDYSVEQM
uniref:Uncharacterized protein n=1 Tax=Anguilla anguilla TaxID=7936 RepID=A0A0E9X6N0_ANGAN